MAGWMLTGLMSLSIWIWTGCSGNVPEVDRAPAELERMPEIFPDYTGVTIPPNIAPLRFSVKDREGTYRFAVTDGHGERVHLKERRGVFGMPSGKWSAMLERNRGLTLQVTAYQRKNGEWYPFAPFALHVASEAIDPYLVYRLIPPGYETWSSMGLYQRDLTSYREIPLIENRNVEDNCVNCHAFNQGNPREMLFHIRGSMGGTMIRKGNTIRKVDLKREETLSAGVYPSWHPEGAYVAFSTNRIEQYFHARTDRSIEVLDRQSDLILFHTESGEVTEVPGTEGDGFMETYPCWAPDGRSLYFSRADADDKTPFDSIRYDIYRLGFDPSSGSFSGEPEPVFEAAAMNLSASFPRVSPDGRYLLCTVHDHGTFPVWHPEADLCLIDLENGSWQIPGNINSGDTESFHSWSANSRWVVVSSRRDDGRYTRPYLCYMDKGGEFRKPFLLPRRDPGEYMHTIYAFNRPELITGAVDVPSRRWIRSSWSNASQLSNPSP